MGGAGTQSHNMTFTPDDANYNTLTQNVNVTVSKANPSVSWPGSLSATYGQTLSNIPLPGNGTGTPAGVFSWTAGGAASVGGAGTQSHNMTFTPDDATNYNALTQNVSVTVSKANPNVTWPTGLTATIGQSLSDISLVGKGSSIPAGSFAWISPGDKVGDAGTNYHDMIFTPTNAVNYNTSVSSVRVDVGKAHPVVNWPTGLTTTYGQTLADLLPLPDNGTGTPGSFSWAVAVTTPVGNAGTRTHNMTFTPTDGNTFNIVTQGVDVNVDKAKVNLPVAATGLVYNGWQQTGVADGAGYSVTNGTATSANNYNATVTLLYPANYKWSDDVETASRIITWGISRKTVTISGFDISKVYDGTSIVTGLGPLLFNGLINGQTANVSSAGVTANYSSVNAGTWSITFAGSNFGMSGGNANPNNYSVISPTGINGVIIKATVNLPVAVTDLVYNGSLQIGVAICSGCGYQVTGDINAINAGIYNVKVTLDYPSNFKWSDGIESETRDIDWSIAKALRPVDIWPVTVPVIYTPGLMLSDVPLEGGRTDLGTFEWTNGSSLLVAGTRYRSVTLTLDQEARNNYDFTGTTETGSVFVSVEKANTTITFTLPSKTYGDADFSIDSDAECSNPDAEIKFRLAPNSPDAVSVSEYGLVKIIHAGTARIEAYVEETANYNAASRSRIITIHPAELKITPSYHPHWGCNVIPNDFNLDYSGFVYNDNPSVLNCDNMQFTTTVIEKCDAGYYDIMVSGITAVNYSITFIPGILEIVKQPVLYVTVAPVSRFYGDRNPEEHEYTIVYLPISDFVDDDQPDEYKISFPPKISCKASLTAPPQEQPYTIELSEASDVKYRIDTRPGELTIKKAILTVTADDKSRYQGSRNPSFTFRYSGFKNDEDSTNLEVNQRPRATTTADEDTSHEESPVSITFREVEENDYYEFVYIEGLLTIYPKVIELPYSRNNFDIKIPFEGDFSMENLSLSDPTIITLESLEGKELKVSINKVGSTMLFLETDKERVSILITVNKKELIVRAKDCEREEGRPSPEFILSYEGFEADDDEFNSFTRTDDRPRAYCSQDEVNTPPGAYKIEVIGGSAENYQIVPNPDHGILTILRRKALPTAFTPNSESANDTWPRRNSGYKVEIYNRLGILIFSGNNGWDGKHNNGNRVQPDVYYYIAASPEGLVYRGTVEVIKTK